MYLVYTNATLIRHLYRMQNGGGDLHPDVHKNHRLFHGGVDAEQVGTHTHARIPGLEPVQLVCIHLVKYGQEVVVRV